MKNIKIFLSAVVLALTFTACSVSNSKTIESTETAFEGTGYFTDFDKYIWLFLSDVLKKFVLKNGA